jgi:outer membrane murein-binding lipoprotein Lpp
MEANKDIRIYGTLVNHTVNSALSDNNHNDALAYAYQIYDDRFGANPNAANFQDAINKRVTAISYSNGVTTIDGNLVVSGNVISSGSSTPTTPTDTSDIQALIDRIAALEQTVAQLSGAIETINGQIESMGGDITQLGQDVDALEETVANLPSSPSSPSTPSGS